MEAERRNREVYNDMQRHSLLSLEGTETLRMDET